MTKHRFKFTKKRKRFKMNGYAKEGREAKRRTLELQHIKEMYEMGRV
jgi:hypothetical protein